MIKLRPVVPDELPAGVRRSPNLVVEVDVMPAGFVCPAPLKGQPAPPGVRDSIAGRQPLRKLFSKEQRAFFTAHAPSGLELDALSILGPIFVLKLSFSQEGYAGNLVGELWLYPDGSRIMELSTKCVPSAFAQTTLDVRSFLSGCRVDLSGEQHTKTKTALEFFSKELRERAAG